MLYAPSSVSNILFSPEVGGCGKEHKAKKGERLSVKCASCEPLIKQYHAGWATQPEGCTLTEEEEAEREYATERGKLIMAAAGATFGEQLAAQAGATVRKPRKSDTDMFS